MGPVFGGESNGWLNETVHLAIALLCGHGEETRVLWLAVREGERSFDGGAERVFVNAIGGGASGAAIGDGADGNGESVLSNILVNAVVGETCERAGDFVNVDFGFFGTGGFGETKNGFD